MRSTAGFEQRRKPLLALFPRNRWGRIQLRGRIPAAYLALILLASFVSLCPANASPSPRTPSSVDQFVTRIESSYHDVKTLSAEFVQAYLASGRTRVESGMVHFARGGRMRWDYREPEQKLFLSDGNRVMLYVPAEKQLTRSPVKASGDARALFRLLLSRVNLRRVFGRIEFAAPSLKLDPADEVLRALPKHEDEDGYHEVLMEFTSSLDIRRLVIRYADQSSMEFTFNRIERNAKLSPTLFKFTPPPGTEIINRNAD